MTSLYDPKLRAFLTLLGVTLGLLACGGSSPTPPDGDDDDDDPVPEHPAGNIALCPSGPFFTVPPVPYEAIDHIGPIGNLSPPAHTFPSPHPGIVPPRVEGGMGELETPPLRAPGDLRIITVSVVQWERPLGEITLSGQDYALYFFPCADVRMYFGHVGTLDETLTDQIGDFDTAECSEYETGGTMIRACSKNVRIDVDAGDPLGTIGGANGALDFGASDRRISPLEWANPARHDPLDEWGSLKFACAFDYFVPAVRAQHDELFGWDYGSRTAEPRCGSVMQDIAGTAQGRWYSDDSPQEDRHLALVRHWIDPTLGAVSMGTSIPGVPWGAYNFPPAAEGRVNLDFPLVTPGSPIVCYEFGASIHTGHPDFVILVQLETETRLRVEALPGQTECGDPEDWGFSAQSVTFVR